MKVLRPLCKVVRNLVSIPAGTIEGSPEPVPEPKPEPVSIPAGTIEGWPAFAVVLPFRVSIPAGTIEGHPTILHWLSAPGFNSSRYD